MKKAVIAVILVVVLVGAGSPFLSGLIMERVVRDAFDNLNQRYAESGHDIRAEIVRYDRGFGSSEIEWRIKSSSLKGVYGIDEVVFVDRAEHNLSGITTRTSLEKNPWYAAFVNSRLGGKDPLHITTTYAMTGAIETTAAVDGFTVREGQETVAVRPGSVNVAFDKEFKKFTSKGVWDGAEVEGKFTVDGISLASDLALISPYVWDGQARMAMKDGKASGEGAEPIAVHGLEVESVFGFDRERKTFSASAEYGADSLSVGTEKIDDLAMKLKVDNLDAARYEEFMRTYTRMMRKLVSAMAEAGNDQQKMKEIVDRQMPDIGFQLVAAGEKLLTKGLEFQLDGLHVKMPEGEIKGDVDVRLKQDMSFARLISMVNQPKLALDVVELKSAVSLPAKLAGDTPLLFSPIYPGMQTGLFVEQGGTVSHAAETRDGKLYLNGKEVMLQ